MRVINQFIRRSVQFQLIFYGNIPRTYFVKFHLVRLFLKVTDIP